MTVPKIDFDKLVRPHWNELSEINAKRVIDFVQLLMNEHDFEEVIRQQAGIAYKQHNRTISDSIDGVIHTVRNLIKTAPEFSYDVKHVYVDADNVVLHSHATLKARHRGNDREGLNIIDIWRLEGGNLVEHWDAVQGISFSMRLYGLLTGGQVRNNNGVF